MEPQIPDEHMPDGEIQDPVIPPIDDKAKKEQDDLFVKRLKMQGQLEGIGHNITIWILRIVVILLIAIGVIRMLYLVFPCNWKWLTEEQIHKIDEFFIHGTVGALVVAFLRDKISMKDNH